MSVTASVTINQTNCGCDGAISIFASNGTPPYTYSIDSGITFKSMPFFTNLCEGLYYIMVKDSNNYVFLKQITIDKPNRPITYTVRLLTSNRTLVDNSTNTTKEYTTNIQITPPLPENTYVTFDLKHNNITTTSPILTATTYNSNSTLTITSGNSAITYTYTATTTSTNTIPGCQNLSFYTNSLVNVWQNLTYYNSYNFQLTTISSSQKNDDYLCYYNNISDTFSIENLKIFGCTCCSIIQE